MVKCPCCGAEYDLDNVPESHKEIVENTKVGYSWFPELAKHCVFVGKEQFADGNWGLSTVWLFEWHDDKDQHDVATVGTLRIKNNKWSWEIARMDGQDGDKLMVEVYGQKYTDFFTKESLYGYRVVEGNL